MLGFYAVSIALVISLSDLNIAFEGLSKVTYNVANLGRRYPAEKSVALSDTVAQNAKIAMPVIDQAFLTAKVQSPMA